MAELLVILWFRDMHLPSQNLNFDEALFLVLSEHVSVCSHMTPCASHHFNILNTDCKLAETG
jgi:hypothetical protein